MKVERWMCWWRQLSVIIAITQIIAPGFGIKYISLHDIICTGFWLSVCLWNWELSREEISDRVPCWIALSQRASMSTNRAVSSRRFFPLYSSISWGYWQLRYHQGPALGPGGSSAPLAYTSYWCGTWHPDSCEQWLTANGRQVHQIKAWQRAIHRGNHKTFSCDTWGESRADFM